MTTRVEKRALAAAYLIAAALLGVNPVDRAAWALENSVPLVEGLLFVWLYLRRRVELTRLSYYLIWLHMLVQIIGGHYTYERVPLFDWLRVQLAWSRNHYDRLAHFAVGFCLYVPIRELCLRRTPLRASRAWAAFFTIAVICAIAGLWEVWEWLVAETAYSDLGTAYLGTQGDPWDAQKDILLAPLGAAVAFAAFTRWHERSLEGVLEDGWKYKASG